MNERGDISPTLQHWFADGPTTMPDRVVHVVADRIARQPQRRGLRLRWGRRPKVNAGLAVAAVVGLLVVALVAAAVIGGSPPFDPPPVRPAVGPVASTAPAPSRTSDATPPAPVGTGLILIEVANLKMPNELRYIAPDKRALPFLPDFGGHQRAAAWSPDGQRVAFAGRPDGHPDQWMDLYETLPDGTSLTLLSTDCEHRHAWTNPTPPIRRTAARSLQYGRRTFEMGRPLGWSSSSLISPRVRARRSRGPATRTTPTTSATRGVARWHADCVPRRRGPADRATPADFPGTDIAWPELDLHRRDRWFRPVSTDS